MCSNQLIAPMCNIAGIIVQILDSMLLSIMQSTLSYNSCFNAWYTIWSYYIQIFVLIMKFMHECLSDTSMLLILCIFSLCSILYLGSFKLLWLKWKLKQTLCFWSYKLCSLSFKMKKLQGMRKLLTTHWLWTIFHQPSSFISKKMSFCGGCNLV